ncbi:MAG: ATP-binding cassette domain-containing protein [Bryobacterales bacterium]|nr:ATP-binding cassette domain-containing protein [Bryobacterales bacterium]
MIRARIRKNFAAGPESSAFSLDVQLELGAGITVLFGPSGAGKTLILDCIAGFVQPDEGRILLDDAILFDGAAHVNIPPRERRCGYVFQNYALFPHMSLRGNVDFAAKSIPRLERHRSVTEMLERFHIAEVAGRRPHEVSGGQKQRCSIARAMIGGPKLLLLDEPARGLDAPLRVELYTVLRQIRAEFGIPILVVTHDLEECFALGEEMLVLRDGRLIQSGPPRKVIEQPAGIEVARLFGIYNLLHVEIRVLDPGRNISRLRYGEFEITGPYFPGRFKGDRVWLCIHPGHLKVSPADGKLGPNQVRVNLLRAVEKPQAVRLEFSGDLAAEVPRSQFERHKHNRDWVIEFPVEGLRVL